MTRAEYADWDHIVYMDEENAWGLERILRGDPDGKVSRLLDWTGLAARRGRPLVHRRLRRHLRGRPYRLRGASRQAVGGKNAMQALGDRYGRTINSGSRPSSSSSQTDFMLMLTRASLASRVT